MINYHLAAEPRHHLDAAPSNPQAWAQWLADYTEDKNPGGRWRGLADAIKRSEHEPRAQSMDAASAVLRTWFDAASTSRETDLQERSCYLADALGTQLLIHGGATAQEAALGLMKRLFPGGRPMAPLFADAREQWAFGAVERDSPELLLTMCKTLRMDPHPFLLLAIRLEKRQVIKGLAPRHAGRYGSAALETAVTSEKPEIVAQLLPHLNPRKRNSIALWLACRQQVAMCTPQALEQRKAIVQQLRPVSDVVAALGWTNVTTSHAVAELLLDGASWRDIGRAGRRSDYHFTCKTLDSWRARQELKAIAHGRGRREPGPDKRPQI